MRPTRNRLGGRSAAWRTNWLSHRAANRLTGRHRLGLRAVVLTPGTATHRRHRR